MGARGTWYPNRGIAMANYDITFRFPQSWTLVASGKQVSLEQEAAQSVGHWISEGPIPIAGFNLGRYVRTTAKAGEVTVNSYATRGVEKEMPKPTPLAADAGLRSRQFLPNVLTAIKQRRSGAAPNPAVEGAQLAARAADTILSLERCSVHFPSVRSRLHSALAPIARAGPA